MKFQFKDPSDIKNVQAPSFKFSNSLKARVIDRRARPLVPASRNQSIDFSTLRITPKLIKTLAAVDTRSLLQKVSGKYFSSVTIKFGGEARLQ